MSGEKVLAAKFHIGIQAGGKVHSSVDALRGGVDIEMCPVGLIVTGSHSGKPFRFIATYNNVIGIELEPAKDVKPAKAKEAK